MAGLLEHPKTDAPQVPPEGPVEHVPEAPQPEAPARTCATCQRALADGQDWCLECGSAQPGRLGGRPGWRAALSVLAITGVLVSGAGAAAYAALTTDAQRTASAPPPPAAAPVVAQAPAQTAPAPAVTAPTPSVKAPASTPPSVPAPTSDPAPLPAPASSPSVSSGATGSTGSSGSTGSAGSSSGSKSGTSTQTTATADPTPLDLPAGAAKTYNPYGRDASAIGDPAKAIDGKSSTAWQAPARADGTVETGLVLTLAKTTTLSDLELTADTPGYSVEVYGTRSSEMPPDVLDSRWEHLGNKTDADVTETFKLDGRYRHVLLWFTRQPADTKVAIPEVQLFG